MPNETSDKAEMSRGNMIGMALSLLSAIVWVIYGLSGAPRGLLIVGVVVSMIVGGWWAFGRQLVKEPGER